MVLVSTKLELSYKLEQVIISYNMIEQKIKANIKEGILDIGDNLHSYGCHDPCLSIGQFICNME